MGNKMKPTDRYACDLRLSREDIHVIKKTNWMDGFWWGVLAGGTVALMASLIVSQF